MDSTFFVINIDTKSTHTRATHPELILSMSHLHLLTMCSNMHQTEIIRFSPVFFTINPFFRTCLFFRLTLTRMHKWRILNHLEFFFLLKMFISSSSRLIIIFRMIRDRKSSSSSCFREMPLNTLCTAHTLYHINIFNVLRSHFHYSIKCDSSNTIVACLSSSVNVIAIGFAKNMCVYKATHCFFRPCVKCRKRARISNANSDEGKQNEKRKSERENRSEWYQTENVARQAQNIGWCVLQISKYKKKQCVCTRTMKGQYI